MAKEEKMAQKGERLQQILIKPVNRQILILGITGTAGA